MHKTSLLCVFLARMRAALCLLENKHLRASEASDSTLVFVFFFVFFGTVTRSERRGEACRSDEMREPSFWYFWMSKISISLSITHFNKHSLSLRVAPPPPNLCLQNFLRSLWQRFTEIPNKPPPRDLARRCHTAASGLLANHHWCCHNDDTATCWLKSGWFHVLMYFHV